MAEKKKNNLGKKIKKFFKTLAKKWKESKTSTKVIIIVLSVLVVLAITGACVVNHYLGLFETHNVDLSDDYIDEDPLNFDTIYDINTATTLNELVKGWYSNKGEKMYSKNVLNVLLLATDSRDKTVLESGNSDTLMLVSLNKETKKITLVSFFRDSYTFSDYDGSNHYTKITEMHGYGGPTAIIKTLENDYKIKIDGYATINFAGFEKVVDALGGVDVPITQAEAKFLASGSTWGPNNPPVYVTAGDSVHLDGYAALWFARIRHLDSDVERTRRQRLVIDAMITKLNSASITEINSAITKFLPYVSTSFSKADILKYASTAITKGWAGFERVQLDMPSEECRTSGFIKTKWMWIVDYPLAAQQLQMALYGKTNIVLQTNRVTALDMKKTDSSISTTLSSSNSGSGYSNETTLPNSQEEITTKQQETTTKGSDFDLKIETTKKSEETTKEVTTVADVTKAND
ncbi:MAG: LCP family protein [Clostridiales bacterium]|nr:LCP family protein [Clostridiales bacterium]